MSEGSSEREIIEEAESEENWFPHPDIAGYEYKHEGSNWRIGVLKKAVEGEGDLALVRNILDTPFSENITRNMARTYISRSLIERPPASLEKLFPDLEVVIDLKKSGIKELENYIQVIFSRNAEGRTTPKETIQQELLKTQAALEKGKEKSSSNLPAPEGIQLVRVTAETDKAIVDSYKVLVQSAFNESDEDLTDRLEGEGIVLAAMTTTGGKQDVIGVVYADDDTDVVTIGGEEIDVKMFEIGGAKVKKGYEGKGIYTFLSQELYKELAQVEGVSAVFGYSNAEEPGVFAVAGRMGRESSYEAAQKFGIADRIKGVAEKQTITDGKLVDEVVTYMSGNTLRVRYGPSDS